MESIELWARNGEAVRQAIELGELVHMETASEGTHHLFYSPFAQSISTILNFKQRMDSFFRDKSKICVLERANEAILIHKLGSKYTKFVNTMKVGMFWTKHSLQPHETSISITNVYSIG